MKELVSRKKIYFSRFLVNLSNPDDSVAKILSDLEKIPFTDNKRYQQTEDGFSVILKTTPYKNYFRCLLGYSRKRELPSLEIKGAITPLSIPTGAAVFEGTHFLYFPEYRILVSEYNHFGPRIIRLGEHLRVQFLNRIESTETTPILNRGAEEILADIQTPKKFIFKVHRTHNAKALDDNLFDALKSIGKSSNGEILELSLSGKRKSANGLTLNFLDKIPNYLSSQASLEGLEELKIVGINRKTGKKETFDFLKDCLSAEKDESLIDDAHKQLNSDDMYIALEIAFQEKINLLKGFKDGGSS